MFRKNVSGQFIHVQGVDVATGGIKTGVTWTVRRCIDGTFAAATGTATEDGTTGWYKFALSQADTNGNNIGFNFTGTGAIPQTVNIVTTAADPTDAADFGLTNLDAAISTRMATYTQPTGFLAATFPSGTIANTTNITAGTITTAGSVTGLTAATVHSDLDDIQARLPAALSAGGNMKSDVLSLGGVVQSLTDLKDFADDGYDPATNKVQGVVLVDTITTYTGNTLQTGDSFARIGLAGAGLTNIDLPNQTMDITGNITGNLSGSVGSVTGAVGSVTGAVGSVTGLTNATIADAVWDEDATAHQTQGTFGQAIGDPAADANTIYGAVVTGAAGATVAADIIAVKAETASIQTDTNDLQTQVGVAGAGLTAINLPDQSMNITGDITGNLSGSVGSVTGAVGSVTGAVGSVTGAVGSVTGNVGGNVTGTVGSVVGAVGSVTGNVGGNVTGTIGGLTAAALKDFFDTDTTTTYASAVAGSVVKEIADNAGGASLTLADIADAVWDEAIAGHAGVGSTGEALSDAGGAGTPPTAVEVADEVETRAMTLNAAQPATTFAALTVTGALTVSNGIDISASTADRAGIAIAGNGTAPGLYVAGGSSGDGIRATSGGSGSGKVGISAIGLGTAGIGIKTIGADSGAGLDVTGGATGHGITVAGGATSGHGINVDATTSGDALHLEGAGNGNGIVAAGQGQGNGIYAASGTGSIASGILAVSNATVAGGAGIYALGAGSAASPGILAIGNGATPDIIGDITGNITGNLTGSVGSVTGLTASNLDATVSSRATQTSVDDLPTNTELATALGTADDAVLAAINDLPTNTELATALGNADDVVLAAVAALNDLSQADIRTAVGLGSANLDTQLGDLPTNTELATALGTADDTVLAAIDALPTAIENADAYLDRANAIETGVTPRQAQRIELSAAAGILSGAATTTVTIRNVGNTKDRITATVDANGNRSAVVVDGT